VKSLLLSKSVNIYPRRKSLFLLKSKVFLKKRKLYNIQAILKKSSEKRQYFVYKNKKTTIPILKTSNMEKKLSNISKDV